MEHANTFSTCLVICNLVDAAITKFQAVSVVMFQTVLLVMLQAVSVIK